MKRLYACFIFAFIQAPTSTYFFLHNTAGVIVTTFFYLPNESHLLPFAFVIGKMNVNGIFLPLLPRKVNNLFLQYESLASLFQSIANWMEDFLDLQNTYNIKNSFREINKDTVR